MTNTVLSLPCAVTSAGTGMGGPTGSFTQNLPPIACISFVDPIRPSPLTVASEVEGSPFCTLPVTQGRISSWAV